MCDSEGLRDDRRADIIQLWEKEEKKKKKKNTSWESKSIHCVMKPIRIQLECPYNSSNKKYPCMSFYIFIIIAQAMYFSVYQHMCARPQAQMCY